jgi:predicted esterase
MQDANAALRFLVAHADEYGIDTNWIFVAGESAGAAIALNSSYFQENRIHSISPLLAQKLGGLHNSGNHYTETYSVKGICNKWGAITDTNLISDNFNIPVISFHGSNDPLIPVEHGYLLRMPVHFRFPVRLVFTGKPELRKAFLYYIYRKMDSTSQKSIPP